MEIKKTVCYEDFGAVGDGVANDCVAIRKTHEYANENGLDVVCNSGKTYYVGAMTKVIPILTNVNWGNSTFIIDDSKIDPMFEVDGIRIRSVGLFVIPSPGTIAGINGLDEWMEKVNAEGGLNKDTFKKIDVNFGENALLRLYNDEHRNYIRYGVNKNAGAIQSEIILVDKDGNIDPNTPLMYDYKKITRVEAYKIDVEPLLIEGGTFITYPYLAKEPQHYCDYARHITCKRSNVTFRNVVHKMDREGEYDYSANTGDFGCPYGGFLSVSHCNNVLYDSCTHAARVAYKGFNGAGMGTYGIYSSFTTNLTYKNCAQEHDNFFDVGPSWRWGVMGSSGNKNFSFIGCRLSRFDAHLGVHNVKLINSEMKAIQTNGTGDLIVENCKLYSSLLIALREDYGGSLRGNVLIKDVTLEPQGKPPALIATVWFNHDFGYPTYLPETIIIDNFRLTSGDTVDIFGPSLVSQLDNALKDEIDGNPNVNKTVPPKKVIIRNNKSGIKFVIPETEYFKNTEFIFED